MSDGTPLPNRTEETPVSGDSYPEDDPNNRRWSEILQDVLIELNANALVSDLAANRADYSPENGMLFVPSDGGDWYLGDGTAWNNLGPIGNLETELAAKADADGGGTASLTNYSNVATNQLNSGGPISDGDGVERQIWVVAAGASDPANAGPEDIIFEESA